MRFNCLSWIRWPRRKRKPNVPVAGQANQAPPSPQLHLARPPVPFSATNPTPSAATPTPTTQSGPVSQVYLAGQGPSAQNVPSQLPPIIPNPTASGSSSSSGMSSGNASARSAVTAPQKYNPGYCVEAWREALERCRTLLGEADFEKVSQYVTPATLTEGLRNLQQDDAENTMHRLLRAVQPCLGRVQHFTTLLAIGQLQNHLLPNVFLWGTFHLMIELAVEFEQTHMQISAWLRDLDHQLHLLYIHQTDDVLQVDDASKGELVDVLVAVAVFAARLIRFYRRDALARLIDVFNTRIKQEFESMIKTIKKKNQELRERIEAIKLQQGVGEATQASGKELQARLPCLVTPWRQNDQFYGRDDILADIGSLLNTPDQNISGPQEMIKSLAIYGTAGIGKTQIALEYGYRCARNGVPAVLWVDSETSLSTEQSFNTIALSLELPGASPKADQSTENHALVMKWLKTTSTTWLLIFDNVESHSLVSKSWPSGTSGSILLTCRTEDIGAECARKTLEIPTLSVDEGMELLLAIVDRPSLNSDVEKISARELSHTLDGLPLALVLMGTQVRSRRMTFEDFLPFHANHHAKLASSQGSNVYYRENLQTAWEIPFKQLGEEPQLLFGMLSFLGPNEIPEKIFLIDQTELAQSRDHDLKFVCHEWNREEALREILAASLMKRDPTSKTICIHRVIQAQYRAAMSRDRALRVFRFMTELIFASFPKQVNGLSLRNDAETCQSLIQHVMALCQSYEELNNAEAINFEFAEFTKLLSSAAWHLLEMNHFDVVLQLVETGFKNCKDEESIWASNLFNVSGAVIGERGDNVRGMMQLRKAQSIREKLLPPDHEELANIYNNLAVCQLSLGNTDDAGKLLNKALAIDMTKPKEERDQILHLRYLNLGDVYLLKKENDEAKKHVELGRAYASKTFGPSSHFVAQSDRLLGNIHAAEGTDLDEAEKYYKRARNMFIAENPTQQAISATTLALGRLLVARGMYDEASVVLQEALQLCRLNEPIKGDAGDSARVMRTLGESLIRQGKKGEGEAMRKDAEAIRKALQGDNYESMPDTRDSWDALVSALYR